MYLGRLVDNLRSALLTNGKRKGEKQKDIFIKERRTWLQHGTHIINAFGYNYPCFFYRSDLILPGT